MCEYLGFYSGFTGPGPAVNFPFYTFLFYAGSSPRLELSSVVCLPRCTAQGHSPFSPAYDVFTRDTFT